MKQAAFESKYRPEWQQFELALDRFGQSKRASKKALATTQPQPDNAPAAITSAQELIRAYRRVCQQLAVARGRHYGPQVVDELNQLATRGHHLLYGNRHPVGQHILSFFAHRFPAMVRANRGLFWLANAAFYGPLILMAVLCYLRPETIYLLQSPETVASFEEMYSPDSGLVGPRAKEREAGDDFLMFGFYIYNNIGIAFQCFALGVLAGIGTLFVQIFNGLHIGATAGYLIQYGASTPFFTFVIAHGAFELTAIVLAGMSGLMLGRAVLMPGRNSRVYALRLAAKDAVVVVWGIFAMLLIAAFVEAFWSSINSFAPWLKYSVGCICWLLVFLYFWRLGRPQPAHIPSQSRVAAHAR